jgi:alpha-beta hydrolase superfamily lysophospholipase
VLQYQEEIIPLSNDSKGPNIAVMIKLRSPKHNKRAVLYIHGYVDYFFQDHLAQWYVDHGFDFYALELRKYGRSILPHQRPNHIRKLNEYYEEVTQAIKRIKDRDGHEFLVVNGHSTGGLVASMYANLGSQKHHIDGLFLNSPFFEFNIPAYQLKILPYFAKIGRAFPEFIFPIFGGGIYGKSLHKEHWGRWNFSTKFKPLQGFRLHFGWFRAIHQAHLFIQNESNIQCPILVFHSDKTSFKRVKDPEIYTSDVVLNVEHIKKYSPGLGPWVTVREIKNAVHDVFLSSDEVVDSAFVQLREWLNAITASK